MSEQVTRPPWRAKLALPSAWFALTCNQALDQEQVPPQVDEHIRAMANTKKWNLRKLRKAIIQSLMSWSATAARSGGEQAAMRWDDDPDFGMAFATLLVTRLLPVGRGAPSDTRGTANGRGLSATVAYKPPPFGSPAPRCPSARRSGAR